jgi:hypothetical protein
VEDLVSAVRWLGLVVALCATSAAAMPLDGAGRVSVMAGWRSTPNTHFLSSATAAGFTPVGRSPGGPVMSATFGYAATPYLEVGIDLFGTTEALRFSGLPDLRSVSYGALLGLRLQTAIPLPGELDLVPFIGPLVGPSLVYVTGGPLPTAAERFVTGFGGSGGLTVRFTDSLAASLEAKLMLIRGRVPPIGSINGGGVWATVGFTYYFPPVVPNRSPLRWP